jgi:Fe-S-cluster containining protein
MKFSDHLLQRIPKVTLTNALLHAQFQLDESKYEILIEHFEKIQSLLRDLAPADQARIAHMAIDKEHEGQTYSCSAGCAACCYYPVRATRAEVQLIKHAAWVKGFDPKLDAKGCPFLDDKECCAVYNVRPATCRNHHVTSEPKACFYPEEGRLSVACRVHGEIIASAYLTLVGDVRTLREWLTEFKAPVT